jgi:hypothetical protein
MPEKQRAAMPRPGETVAGRIVEATIKAIVDTTDGVRLQVSFGMRRR